MLKAIQESSSLKSSRFAVVADEAHSSQTGKTARQLREVLMAEQLNDEEELSAEGCDELLTLAARGGSQNISYFAFTATPKAKTLELFGRSPKPHLPISDENKPEPFHVYTMRQAIEEGSSLTCCGTTPATNWPISWRWRAKRLMQKWDSKKAKRKLSQWVRLHPHNIGQKVQVIVEHFRQHVAPLLAGQIKAMVVTSSRMEAVRYKLAFDKYVKVQGYQAIRAMVAFSGDIEDEGQTWNERNMNPELKGRDTRKAFDTADYQVMLVANKFQTGFDQPKLCAMYVDKKLTGVDCIQTLSRLNRTYPGKESTYVLDFVNDPQDVLEEFQSITKPPRWIQCRTRTLSMTCSTSSRAKGSSPGPRWWRLPMPTSTPNGGRCLLAARRSGQRSLRQALPAGHRCYSGVSDPAQMADGTGRIR